MQSHTSLFQCACECAKNQFEITAQPLVRFVCHCEVCQAFTHGPYSDVIVTLSKDVNIQDINATTFKRMKAPPNINRGSCIHCNKPSIEFGLLNQLTFVPIGNFKETHALPEPSMHIFYHRRVADIDDALPKYSGFIKSEAAVIALLGKSIFNHWRAN